MRQYALGQPYPGEDRVDGGDPRTAAAAFETLIAGEALDVAQNLIVPIS
jgi:hypothetical protein